MDGGLRFMANLRWCSLTVTSSATVVCRTPMLLQSESVSCFQHRARWLNLPVQQTAQGPRDECHPDVGRESEDQDADGRAGQAGKQDGLATNLVAQASP